MENDKYIINLFLIETRTKDPLHFWSMYAKYG